MYEVYKVPNDELDGTEEYLNSFNTLDEAKEYKENTFCGSSLWIILANDEKGYIRVICT